LHLLQVLDAAVLFDLGAATVTASFGAFMGGLLGLQPNQIAVKDAVVTPGATVSTSTSAYVPLQARTQPPPDELHSALSVDISMTDACSLLFP